MGLGGLLPCTVLSYTCACQFMEFAKGVCNDLDHKGIWCDYIDPCSGLPVRHTLFICSCTCYSTSSTHAVITAGQAQAAQVAASCSLACVRPHSRAQHARVPSQPALASSQGLLQQLV